MLLDKFPRVPLAHLPTPLEYLPRLSAELGGPQIYVKRDDCTGLATGGNKTRKLEFSMAAALEAGADTIVTVGAYQSNHVRQAAAAACKLGLGCEVLLEHRVDKPTDDYLLAAMELGSTIVATKIWYHALQHLPNNATFSVAADQLAESARILVKGGYVPKGATQIVRGALREVGMP